MARRNKQRKSRKQKEQKEQKEAQLKSLLKKTDEQVVVGPREFKSMTPSIAPRTPKVIGPPRLSLDSRLPPPAIPQHQPHQELELVPAQGGVVPLGIANVNPHNIVVPADINHIAPNMMNTVKDGYGEIAAGKVQTFGDSGARVMKNNLKKLQGVVDLISAQGTHGEEMAVDFCTVQTRDKGQSFSVKLTEGSGTRLRKQPQSSASKMGYE